MNALTATAAPAGGGFRTRRRRRWMAVGVAAIALVVICHAPLLRGMAGWLIVDDSLPAGRACVVIWNGDRQLDVAADLYRRGAAEGVLLIEEYPPRLVREGILPPREEFLQQALSDRGLPRDRLMILPGRVQNDWQGARLLAQWQSQQPGVSMIVLGDRFDSRRQQRVLASALGETGMQTVYMRALPDRRFDERDWWKSRDGWKGLFHCAVSATYDYWCGEPTVNVRQWDPDEYERTLKSSLPRVASAHE